MKKKGGEYLVSDEVWQAAGVDGIVAEFLKNESESVVDWLVRMFSTCLAQDEVLDD